MYLDKMKLMFYASYIPIFHPILHCDVETHFCSYTADFFVLAHHFNAKILCMTQNDMVLQHRTLHTSTMCCSSKHKNTKKKLVTRTEKKDVYKFVSMTVIFLFL